MAILAPEVELLTQFGRGGRAPRMQQLLAQQLLQGSKPLAPITNPTAGLAYALQEGLRGYTGRQLLNEAQSQDDADYQRAQGAQTASNNLALQIANGGAPVVNASMPAVPEQPLPGANSPLTPAVQRTELAPAGGKALADAVHANESSGRMVPGIYGDGGQAAGPMQVHPAALADVNKDLGTNYTHAQLAADPAIGKQVGDRYLAMQRQRFGRDDYALGAYNAGPGAMQAAIDSGKGIAGLPTSAQQYVTRATERLNPGQAMASKLTQPNDAVAAAMPTAPDPSELRRRAMALQGLGRSDMAAGLNQQAAQIEAARNQQSARLDAQQFQRETRADNQTFQAQQAAENRAARQQAAEDARAARQQAADQAAADRQARTDTAREDRQSQQTTARTGNIVKQEEDDLSAIASHSGLNADLGALRSQLGTEGALPQTAGGFMFDRGANMVGMGGERAANVASLDATLTRMVNESLRLNKGVQTEGDAQRTAQEIVANRSNPTVLRQRLAELQQVNDRAIQLRTQIVQRRRRENGLPETDLAPFVRQPATVGGGAGNDAAGVLGPRADTVPNPMGQGAQGDIPTVGSVEEAQKLPSGTVFRAPDGRVLRVP